MKEVTFSSPRLILKGFGPAFINKIYKTQTKVQIKTYFGFGDEGYEHYKAMHENGMETHRLSLYGFLLIDKESQQVIGECGFHTWNRTHARAELYYSLRADEFKQKGLMKEALAEILKYGFTEMKLHRVAALTGKWNTASLKLLTHYGFRFEGTMREDYVVNGKSEDSECYSLLRGEWETRNK